MYSSYLYSRVSIDLRRIKRKENRACTDIAKGLEKHAQDVVRLVIKSAAPWSRCTWDTDATDQMLMRFMTNWITGLGKLRSLELVHLALMETPLTLLVRVVGHVALPQPMLHAISALPALQHLQLPAQSMGMMEDYYVGDMRALNSLFVTSAYRPYQLAAVESESLREVSITFNSEQSLVAEWFAALPNVSHLKLSNVSFRGECDDRILTNLQHLEVSCCRRVGWFNARIGNQLDGFALEESATPVVTQFLRQIGRLEKLRLVLLNETQLPQELVHILKRLAPELLELHLDGYVSGRLVHILGQSHATISVSQWHYIASSLTRLRALSLRPVEYAKISQGCVVRICKSHP